MQRIGLFCLALLFYQHACAQSPLWRDLRPGPFRVGFTSIGVHDLSRKPMVDQELDGRPGPGVPAAPGRQILIHVWYPSTERAKVPLKYIDYVHELSRELDFSPLNEMRKQAAVEKLVARYSGDYSNSFNRESLNKFLPLNMYAANHVRPAKGKFPVLLFPHWFSPADGSIMSEYLSSQGFVIASISLKGTDSPLPEISPRGLVTMAADLAFAVQQLEKLPYADVTRLALMGVGVNASACATLMKDNSTVDAFISLEGGIITAGELAMFQQTGMVMPSEMTMPMLFIHAPHPSVNPGLADYFKYADRYFLGFHGMSEYFFLNNGMIERFAPGMFSQPPGDVKAGFEAAARVVAAFLNYTLKQDEPAKAVLTLSQPGELDGANRIERTFKAALQAPPDLHALKVIASTEGGEGLKAAYERLKPTDSKPFTQLQMADLFTWLGFGRDGDFSRRMELVRIWLDMYPDAARGEYMYGRLLSAQGKPADAVLHYRRSLALLDSDTDMYLDNVLKNRLRLLLENEIKSSAN